MIMQAGRNGRLEFLCGEKQKAVRLRTFASWVRKCSAQDETGLGSGVFANELFEPGADEVADLTEGCGLAAARDSGGIGETLMDTLAGTGEDRAGFAGVVANGDHVIEMLAGEFIDGF